MDNDEQGKHANTCKSMGNIDNDEQQWKKQWGKKQNKANTQIRVKVWTSMDNNEQVWKDRWERNRTRQTYAST